jgi:hypothetical protein
MFVLLASAGGLSAAAAPASLGARVPATALSHRAREARTFTYRGVLTTRIHYLTICGHDLGVRENRLPIEVTVGPPLRPKADSPGLPPPVGSETNGLHLGVGSTSGHANGSPGFIFLASALEFHATSPPVILQYWALSLHGERLRGRLVHDHRAEGAAANELNAITELVPCQPQFGTFLNAFAISEGATVEGKITTQRVHLLITGNVVEGTRPFAARIDGRRG